MLKNYIINTPFNPEDFDAYRSMQTPQKLKKSYKIMKNTVDFILQSFDCGISSEQVVTFFGNTYHETERIAHDINHADLPKDILGHIFALSEF